MSIQGKNTISSERRGELIVVLNASITGTAAGFDTVAAFSGASVTTLGSYPLASFITNTFSATDGTTIKISRRGLWFVNCHVRSTATGAATVVAGISLDAAAAALALDPDPTSAAFLATTSVAYAAAAEGGNLAMAAIAPITDTLAGGAATGLLRLQLSNGAGAVPAAAAGIVVASANIRVEYAGDLAG